MPRALPQTPAAAVCAARALCRRAQIGTIHSFCANVLRENCHALGLTPDFKIADEERPKPCAPPRSSALSTRAMTRWISSPASACLPIPSARADDRRLSDLVLKLHSRMQCHARPEDWARRQVALKGPGAGRRRNAVGAGAALMGKAHRRLLEPRDGQAS